MSQSFDNIPGVIVMFDDILVTGRTEKEHDINLENVIKRAREVGVRLNKQKSKFNVDKVKYILGISSVIKE